MTLTAHGVNSMIVVSIIEGKNFPVRHDKLLLVEAKFDGEVMSTDPTTHTTFPYFNTELAWEVDKKSLQLHRLHRTVIKLLFYAADHELMRKEPIGYIVLDMRVAQETSKKPTWLPLLNCKYHKEKPEVLIKLYLEKETAQTGLISQRSNFSDSRPYSICELKPEKRNFSFNAVPKSTQRTPDSSLPKSSNILKPVLLPESTIYRIGPPERCQENFIFSITLAFAANLNKLAPPAPLRTSKDFYFYYSLFENGITTGRFASLSNPDFLAERASVKILSSTNLLASYFEQHSNLELFLYCGDEPLASGHIPLGPLASVNRQNIDEERISIERSVHIYPIEKPCKFGGEDLSPFVGVEVVLQKAEELVTPDKPKVNTQEVFSNGSSFQRGNPCSRQSSTSSCNGNEVNGNSVTHKESFESSVQPCHNYSRTHSREYDVLSERVNSTPVSSFVSVTHNPGRSTTAKSQLPPTSGSSSQTANTRNMNGHLGSDSTDNVPHHFCFSLDLSNFRATRLEHPVNVFIRYSYPFFGSSASILSQPEIEVLPGMEVNIPHGFCAFNFATTLNSLKTTFCESPLILEVIHCKKQGNRQEQLVGTAKINLFQVLDAASRPHVMDSKQGARRMCTCNVSVVTSDGYEIGDIHAVLSLDDFGPTTSFCDKNSSKAKTPVLTQLKEKEMQHLRVLVNEWKQRDTEREILLQRRLHDCQKLEDKLKQTLQDAEIKEKQLASQQNEHMLQVQNYNKQKEAEEKEMQLRDEKMKAEYNEIVRLERMNAMDLQEKNTFLQRKIRDLESELQEHKTIIETLRSQLNKPPDIQLKTEVNILRMEKTELRQKLQAVCSSKEKYKHQYSQLMGQYSILQQKLLVMEQLNRNRKDEELAIIQQRLLPEEKSTSQKNGQTAEKADERVSCLPSTEIRSDENEQESPSSQSASDSLQTPSKSEANDEDNKNCNPMFKRLLSQKELLLKSGFKENDQIMQHFNSKLEEAKLTSL